MKATIFVAALLLFWCGCTLQQPNQLTQQQQDQIKSEVKATCDSIVVRWERLDAEGSLQCYSPELVVVNDSARTDFATYKKGWVEYTPSLAATKWTTIRVDVIALTADLALCTGVWKSEDYLKSGDKETYNPIAYTLLFKKVAGQWKVTYSHASGVPVVQKAAKK